MLNVDNWTDADNKLHFKRVAQGEGMQQLLPDDQGQNMNLLAGMPSANHQQNHNPTKKGYVEGNVTECGICFDDWGKLISCDDCPGAFHATCLGYDKQCPRGKWKCYFCKVTRHGIPFKVPRMAPKEKPVCDILANTKCPTWEHKASQLFDILEEHYFCAKSFFEPIRLTSAQLDLLKKKARKKKSE